MAQSIVEICNSALSLIGETRIANATLSGTTEAERQCELQYDISRATLLRLHPWNFAEKRSTLASEVETPAFEFDYYYSLPSDCVRVLHVYNDNGLVNQEKYRVEAGRRIATSSTTCKLIYTSDVTDVTKFDSLFTQALIYHLAESLALVLADNKTLRDSLTLAFEKALAQARMIDAQEGMPRARTIQSTWRSFRGGWKT